MQRLLATAQVTRTYLALARGAVASGGVDRALVGPLVGGSGAFGRRHSVPAGTPGALAAATHIDVLAVGRDTSLVRASLVTGRTHQVRIHLADTGHPILGDRVYGCDVAEAAPRLMLHAWFLGFVHPNSHAPVTFTASPPDDFAGVVAVHCGERALPAGADRAHTRPHR